MKSSIVLYVMDCVFCLMALGSLILNSWRLFACFALFTVMFAVWGAARLVAEELRIKP